MLIACVFAEKVAKYMLLAYIAELASVLEVMYNVNIARYFHVLPDIGIVRSVFIRRKS